MAASEPGGLTAAVLGPLLRTGGAGASRPRLTVYTADGGRTELSTASLANWSAKVAGLLADELGVRPGDRVAVLAPTGWQTAPVLLGAWWVGAVVTDVDDPDAVAAFVADGADAAAEEVFVVSGHPLGAPSRSVLGHQRDFTTAVLPQADRFGPGAEVTPDDVVISAGGPDGAAELTLDEALQRVMATAARLGPAPRLLADRPWSLPHGVLDVLLAPLAADGSLVQLPEPSRLPTDPADGAPDAAAVAAAERVSLAYGVVVDGVAAVPSPG